MPHALDPRLKRFVYLLVGGGFYTLYLANYAAPWMLGGLLLLMVLAYHQERLRLPISGYHRLWNTLLVGALLWLGIDGLFISQNLLENSMLFTLVLQANRLLNARTDKDHLQMALLAFLQLIVSTVFTERVEFIIPFLFFLVVGVWVLTIYTVRGQVREAYGPEEGERQVARLTQEKVLNGRFLAAESLLSLSLLLATMIVFYTFPRMSFGYFYKKSRNPNQISGFSENISLGSINTIKERQAVVMRVLLDEVSRRSLRILETGSNGQLYWRGTALDFYDGRGWSHAQKDKQRRLVDGHGQVRTGLWPQQPTLKMEIYLEPSESRVVFGLDRVLAIGWDKTFMERIVRRRSLALLEDDNRGYSLVTDFSADRHYFVESDPQLGDPTSLVGDGEELDEEQQQRYLQPPPRLDPRLAALVRRIVAGRKTPYERMRALERYLLANYRYTLAVNDNGVGDPLVFFLLQNKKGHCEYFSTALAILGRIAGVPTRNAIGFLGGEWNVYGNYLAVRENNAHSWVEAYLPGRGWQRFDATPPQEGTALRSFGVLDKYYDYLKLRWYRYVVDYDLRTQRDAALSVWERTRTTPRQFRQALDWFRRGYRQIWEQARQHRPTALVLALVFAVLVFAWRRWRRILGGKARQQRQRQDRLLRLYQRFLADAGKRGFYRQAAETYGEFAARLARRDAALERPAQELAAIFYRLRFGPGALTETDYSTAAAAVERFRRTAKERRRQSGR